MKKILLDSLKTYKWYIIIQIVLMGISIYLLTVPATIVGKIIDLLYNMEKNRQEIINNIYLLLGVCVIYFIIRIIWKYCETYTSRGPEKYMKIKLFHRFLELKLQNIQSIKNGEIMSYFVKDINEIRSTIWRMVSHGSRVVFIFIIAIYKMASGVNLYLTIVVMLPIIISSIVVVKIKKYVEINFKKSQEKFTEMSEYIQESTDSIRTTKAYACEKKQIKDFIRKNKLVCQSNNVVDVFSNLLSSSVKICFGICYSISLLFGSKLVLEGKITVGDLVTFNGYIGLFVNPVNWIPALISRFKRAQISYERLDKVFALSTEKINIKSNIKGEKLFGNIEINNLSFCYPEVIYNALSNINLKIEKGQTLGIIGTIGSGKTTLMNLITRLYNVPNEKIIIDGKDINDIPLEVLRNNICYITQDNFLFSTTLKENVSLFQEKCEEEDIRESTRKAIIYDDIQNMPEGLSTVIGERGGDLSGGQKQRIAISRAFFKNSSILIFDDTFSALDNKTSEQLLENIKELTNNRTCIIISNRVSDVKNSDIIIVLDNGQIIEEGTHNELLEINGIYSDFYKRQSKKVEENILA